MQDKTGNVDGGFGAASKRGRGRPRKDSGATSGNQERTVRVEEFNGASTVASEQQPESEPQQPEQPERVAGFTTIDPFNAPEPGSDRPKRGRRAGSTSRKAAAVSGDLGSIFQIEKGLKTACLFLGTLAASPEIQLTDDEAKEVADATRELAKHYPAIQVADKTMAWVNFSMAVGSVFGPKVIAIARRPKPGKLVQMRQQTQGSPVAGSPVQNDKILVMPFGVPVDSPVNFVPPPSKPESGDSNLRSPGELGLTMGVDDE